VAYNDYEISAASGQPVEFYDIAMGVTHWRLTSGGVDVDHLGHTYESSPCKRTEIEQTGNIPKDGIEFELPKGHALGRLCISGVPEEEITLTIYRGHGTFFVTYFRGFLTNVKFDGNAIPICFFEPRSSDLPFVGGRRRCMRTCGHKLFGYRCGLNKDDYKITGTIDTISGVTITASEFGAAAAVPDVYGDLTKLEGCTYSANINSSIAYKAFDGSIGDFWASGSSYSNNWIYCKWTSAQTIKKIRIRPGIDLSRPTGGIEPGWGCMKFLRIAGSNNGTVWTTIPVIEWLGNCQVWTGAGGNDTYILKIIDHSEWIGLVLDNDSTYTYYRLYVYDHWKPGDGDCSLTVNEVEMIEADNAMAVYYFGAGGEIIIGKAHRTITAQVGDTITINRPFGTWVAAGDSFEAHPGCDHTPATCRIKYGNGINYGGLEGLPVKNHYVGDLIY